MSEPLNINENTQFYVGTLKESRDGFWAEMVISQNSVLFLIVFLTGPRESVVYIVVTTTSSSN